MIGRLRDALFFRPPEAAAEVPGAGALTFALHAGGDRWISDVIRRGEIFDPQILAVLRDLIVPGTTLIDVGANIGWFSVIGSRLVGEAGHVLAVEPEPRNLRLLRRNVARNRCRNVTVLPWAAGAEARVARLFRSDDNQGDHRLEVASERADSVAVDVRPLDAVPARWAANVGAIKMDTQGSEAAVLRGMANLLAANPLVRVVLEFWPYGLLQCGSSTRELADLLGRRNGALWLLRHDGAAEETSPDGLCEAAATTFAPATQAHADLVWLAADDREAAAAMRRRR